MNYERILMTMAVLTFIFTAGLSAQQARANQGESISQGVVAQAEMLLETLESDD